MDRQFDRDASFPVTKQMIQDGGLRSAVFFARASTASPTSKEVGRRAAFSIAQVAIHGPSWAVEVGIAGEANRDSSRLATRAWPLREQRFVPLGDTGLEHPPKTPGKTQGSDSRGTISGTLTDAPAGIRGAAGGEAVPSDLAVVLRAWPDLDAKARADILRIVKAAKPGSAR